MENPHATIARSHQHRICVNVWARIVDNFLLDPYILPERLNANTHLIFLQNVLPELLHPIPLNFRRSMRFQHDGASPHFGNAVRGYLTATLDARWIGRGGPTAWPTCSPDLTCPWFLFVELHEVNGLWNRYWLWRRSWSTNFYHSSWNKGNPWHLWKGTTKNGTSRCTVCLDVNRRVFQHLLWSMLTMQHWSERFFFFF